MHQLHKYGDILFLQIRIVVSLFRPNVCRSISRAASFTIYLVATRKAIRASCFKISIPETSISCSWMGTGSSTSVVGKRTSNELSRLFLPRDYIWVYLCHMPNHAVRWGAIMHQRKSTVYCIKTYSVLFRTSSWSPMQSEEWAFKPCFVRCHYISLWLYNDVCYQIIIHFTTGYHYIFYEQKYWSTHILVS